MQSNSRNLEYWALPKFELLFKTLTTVGWVQYKSKSILYETVPYNVEYEKIDAKIVNLNSLIEEEAVKQSQTICFDVSGAFPLSERIEGLSVVLFFHME